MNGTATHIASGSYNNLFRVFGSSDAAPSGEACLEASRDPMRKRVQQQQQQPAKVRTCGMAALDPHRVHLRRVLGMRARSVGTCGVCTCVRAWHCMLLPSIYLPAPWMQPHSVAGLCADRGLSPWFCRPAAEPLCAAKATKHGQKGGG
jgi:hypothetical protein